MNSERFNQLVQNLNVGVLLQGPNAEVISSNRTLCKMLGLSRDEIEGSTSFDVGQIAIQEDGSPFPGADHPASRVIATGKPVHDVVMGFKRPSSKDVVWSLVNADPQLGPDGRVQGVVSTLIDITASRQAEARLRESEARYRQLVERATDIIVRTDVDGRLTYVNPATTQILGYQGHELRGRNYLDLIHRDHRQTVREHGERQFRERIPSTYIEFVALPRDGRELWLGQNVELLSDGEWVAGFQVVARDITLGKQAERALEKERRQLQQIIARAPMAMAIFGPDGRYLVHNEQWLRYWDPRGRPVIGNTHVDLFGSRPEGYSEALQHALRGQPFTEAEDRLRLSDGAEAYVSWSLHPWNEPNGTIAGVVAAIKDIDELVQARRKAEGASRSKSELLAGMSREMQKPLNAIVGSSRLLVDSGLGETQRQYARTVQTCSKNLVALALDVLEFANAEMGEVEIIRTRFDLRAALDEIVDTFKEEAGAKGLRLASTVEEDVPELVWSDQDRLQQVLGNLLGNAIQFTAQGSVTVRTTRETDPEQPSAMRVEVTDTGIGMSTAVLERLFQPFTEVSAATEEHGVSGLRLATSRRLVELWGGQMGARSEVGQGSTFWFTIGLRRAVASDAPATDADPPFCARVLLAEDNDVNVKVTTAMLEALGCAVEAVGDGIEAVDACSRQHFDAVLMDCQMPNMDGLKAAAFIREREGSEARIPIIALTGSTLKGDRERCLAAGMDEYLVKPLRLEELGIALRRWVPKARGGASRRRQSGPVLAADHPIRVLEHEAGSDVVVEVLELFVRTTPERIAALRAAQAESDLVLVGELAHDLKGGAVQLGVGGIADVCEQLVSCCEARERERVDSLLGALDAAWPAVSRYLKKEMRRIRQ